MKIIEIIKKWFTKSKPEKTEEIKQSDPVLENPFYCHYCHKVFNVNPEKDVFPLSVKALYKDYFFQGIGVKCPHCQKDCIYG